MMLKSMELTVITKKTTVILPGNARMRYRSFRRCSQHNEHRARSLIMTTIVCTLGAYYTTINAHFTIKFEDMNARLH